MSNDNDHSKLPGRYRRFMGEFPHIAAAYDSLGEAARGAGPLDAKTITLVKLGMAMGMRHEGAVHSHTRKALEAGATPAEIRHAAVVGVTTMGFPGMMAALSWVDDILNKRAGPGQ